MARRAQAGTPGTGRPVLADPLYYLNNFRAVLTSLESRYWTLLTAEERQFIRQFARLPEPSCALLVRMIMRVGMLFRSSRLEYPEIGDIAAAAAPLLHIGWLQEPALDAATLHRVLTKAELVVHLPLNRDLSRLDKPDLLAVLRERFPELRPLAGWCKRLGDRVFRSEIKPLAERLRLIFFGNFHQDWKQFVLSDLGVSCYERVSVHSAPFRTRAHIDAFYQLYRCQLALEDGTELMDIVGNVPRPITDSDWLEEHRQRLLFQVGTAYERLDDVSAASAVFSTCRHRGARMRTVRSLELAQKCEAARDLCLAAISSPESEAERQQVRRVLPRLNRKLGLAEEKSADGLTQLASFDVQLDTFPDGRALEFQVRDHLARQEQANSTVHYVENGLINSLFGLLCWDAIFAPIPGAFFHDFQYGPADLESPYFYQRRRERFAQCFSELESGRYKDIIRQRLCAKAGIQTPFVAWGLLSRPLLEHALRCFPASHLRLWFEWIVRDVVENRTGYPDLVQFWPGEQRYRMVEIKGPGDRLRDNQRRFLEFCTDHRMQVFVCRVTWARMRIEDRGRLRKGRRGSNCDIP